GKKRRAAAHLERRLRTTRSRLETDSLTTETQRHREGTVGQSLLCVFVSLWLTPSSNRGKNQNRVAVLHLGIQFLLVPNVVLIHKHIDKPLHVFPLIQNPITKSLELRIQLPKDFAYSSAFDLYIGLTACYRPQRRWNFHGNVAHFESPS